MKNTLRAVVPAILVTFAASAVSAQSISIGLRGSGSIPTGSFSEPATSDPHGPNLIGGAKNGFGYGLDVAFSLNMFGIYAGFDRVKFDCEASGCQADGKYTLQGATAGVKLSPPMAGMLHPFVKAGVTFNDLQGGYGGSSSNVLTADRAPGYEVAVGADITLVGILSVTPQARYIGQELKAKVPGVSAPAATGQGVNYFSLDLGVSVHTPFGR